MTAAVKTPTVVTEPGVYPDMTAEEYHADAVPAGSLSSSGVKKLLRPNCPAIYRYERDHGQPHKRVFDFGHAAHKRVLGVGAEIMPLDFKDYKTKKAQAERDEAYAVGKVPLLRHEYESVLEMERAIRAHPLASALFDPDAGPAEQALFWVDGEAGIWRRAMLDKLFAPAGGRPLIVDYKSLAAIDAESLEKALIKFGYAGQADWYSEGARSVGLVPDDAAFVFVAQMKTPPYLIHVFQPDADAYAHGREVNRRGIEVFARCQETGVWPGFAADTAILEISVPRWADRLLEDL